MSFFFKFLSFLGKEVLKGMILFYRGAISPFLRPRCRFFPTCSDYGLEALRLWGWRGIGLVGRRLVRCHPFKGEGWDLDPVPVPSMQKTNNEKKVYERTT